LEKLRESKNRLALGIFEKLTESKNRLDPGISKAGSFLVFPGSLAFKVFSRSVPRAGVSENRNCYIYNRMITEKIQHCLKELPNTSITLITHKELVD
jgi:hypothetical protein